MYNEHATWNNEHIERQWCNWPFIMFRMVVGIERYVRGKQLLSHILAKSIYIILTGIWHSMVSILPNTIWNNIFRYYKHLSHKFFCKYVSPPGKTHTWSELTDQVAEQAEQHSELYIKTNRPTKHTQTWLHNDEKWIGSLMHLLFDRFLRSIKYSLPCLIHWFWFKKKT